MIRWQALLDAYHKRAHPIIMTTLAMGTGMMPIAMGQSSAEASFRSPMAVLGGLIRSTVLGLLVIPVLFTYVDDAVDDAASYGIHTMKRPHAMGSVATLTPIRRNPRHPSKENPFGLAQSQRNGHCGG